jgi:hypothetical protein
VLVLILTAVVGFGVQRATEIRTDIEEAQAQLATPREVTGDGGSAPGGPTAQGGSPAGKEGISELLARFSRALGPTDTLVELRAEGNRISATVLTRSLEATIERLRTTGAIGEIRFAAEPTAGAGLVRLSISGGDER